jgi:hypothetical protein
MRVGEDDGIEGGKVDGWKAQVAATLFVRALVQTEINENTGGVGLYEVAGSGDLARGSEGGEFHERMVPP